MSILELNTEPHSRSFPRIALWVIPATLVVFGLIVAGVSLRLRSEIRQQIISRDAEVLSPVALMLLEQADKDAILNPLFDVLLTASELRGVIAVRLFDAEGEFVEAIPDDFLLGELSGEDLQSAYAREPVSRFHPHVNYGDYFVYSQGGEGSDDRPLLEVIIPLYRSEENGIAGISQFLIDGGAITAEFAALDRNLMLQAGMAFLSGGAIIAIILFWSFRRLQQSRLLLEERGRKLLEANAELTLAAKSSAIGAVTSHLLHGLKNPLSGLQEFVSTRNDNGTGDRDEEWRNAAESARRMQDMIQEIVDVLRDEESAADFDFTVGEIRELIASKAEPIASRAGVVFEASPVEDDVSVDNRRANLLMLILMNLIQNAVEASPPGAAVGMDIERSDEMLAFRITDQGGGLPEHVRNNIFAPCRSSKEKGSGIGLTISHQLARHIGSRLQLESSTPQGTVFSITMDITANSSVPSDTR